MITTRVYEDRLRTIAHVRNAGITVCCGGILGMGETDEDRVGLLHELSRLDPHPESVPINMLVRNEGTPLADAEELDPLVMVRTIATARILMPASRVRLAAGRQADVGRGGDALLSRGREFDFHGRETADDAQSLRRLRPAIARESRHEGDAECLTQRRSAIERRIARELDSLRDEAQFRTLEILDGAAGLNLSSNDYLGLSTDPRLKQATIEAVARAERVGSTGSRLLSGNSREWEEIEAEFAAFAGTEAAVYFGSGYACQHRAAQFPAAARRHCFFGCAAITRA